MIHAKTQSEIISTANPFYLLCDGQPLPLAVKAGNPEAMMFRDVWEASATREEKQFCCYHPVLRNWVGGFENGAEIVAEAQAA